MKKCDALMMQISIKKWIKTSVFYDTNHLFNIHVLSKIYTKYIIHIIYFWICFYYIGSLKYFFIEISTFLFIKPKIKTQDF